MKPRGPCPFGIFKIPPKIRLGRRFANLKENQHIKKLDWSDLVSQGEYTVAFEKG